MSTDLAYWLGVLAGFVLGVVVCWARVRTANQRADEWQEQYADQCRRTRRILSGYRRIVIASPATVDELVGSRTVER
jgi:hypothetical protein